MGPMSAATPPTERRVSARVGAISESATLAVDAKAKALKAAGRPVIGFGAGEHLADRADMLPDHGFIGCEPFLNGVVGALLHVRDLRLTNVRLHMGDALQVLARVPDEALSFAYLLHPDPWPKAKHAKRRMMNDGPLDLIATKLAPGGEFRMATDHPVYLNHALMVMQRHRHQFEWLVEGPADWLTYPGGWPETRYAAKARREGRTPHQFRYRRL